MLEVPSRAIRCSSIFAAFSLFVTACSAPAGVTQPETISADLGDLRFEVPGRPDLYQPQLVEGLIAVRVCNRESAEDDASPVRLCEDMHGPLVNRYGISTFLHPPRAATYSLLRARPSVGPPPPKRLVPIPASAVDRDFRSGGESYELGRVDLGSNVGELQTTEHEWPIAACKVSLQGNRQCGIGFLIDDVFVEAHWTAEPGVALYQAEVWSIAAALDDKIRGLIVNEPRS